MAGTVTITEETIGTVKKIIFAWTSDADGAADGITTKVYAGEVIRLVTVPSGVAAPTNLYDIQVLDADGLDVLAMGGANRSTLNTEQVLEASLGCVANSKLALSIANAGNAKAGTVYLYIR